MGQAATEKPVEELLDKVLGHLNFSSGQHDPKFVANLDRLYRIEISASPSTTEPDSIDVAKPTLSQPSELISRVNARLRARLSEVKQSSETFRDAVQVETILNLVFDDFLPAYALAHRDLLFHQTQDFVFNSFFVARVFETVMQKSAAGGSPQDIIACLLYTSPSPRDQRGSRMPSSA